MDNTSGGLTTKDTIVRVLFTGFLIEAYHIIYQNRWLFILALILVLVDFRFGINVSKKKGVPIRWSRAFRRTINKFIDYMCYIALSMVLGEAIGKPLGIEPIIISTITMVLCCGFELDSIWSHICILHNIKKPVSMWKLLLYIFTLRFKEIKTDLLEIGDNIEKEINKNNQTNK